MTDPASSSYVQAFSCYTTNDQAAVAGWWDSCGRTFCCTRCTE